MEKVSRKKFVRGMLMILDKYPREQVLPFLAQELVARGWSNELDVLMKEAALLRLKQDRHLEIKVESARKLPNDVKEKLAKVFKKISGASATEMQTNIVPSLKGGAVVDTPIGQLDISISSLLNQLRNSN